MSMFSEVLSSRESHCWRSVKLEMLKKFICILRNRLLWVLFLFDFSLFSIIFLNDDSLFGISNTFSQSLSQVDVQGGAPWPPWELHCVDYSNDR